LLPYAHLSSIKIIELETLRDKSQIDTLLHFLSQFGTPTSISIGHGCRSKRRVCNLEEELYISLLPEPGIRRVSPILRARYTTSDLYLALGSESDRSPF